MGLCFCMLCSLLQWLPQFRHPMRDILRKKYECFFLWGSVSFKEIHSQSPQQTSPSCLMGQNFIPCPFLKGKELPQSASTNVNPLEALTPSLEVCDRLTWEQKQDSISKVEDRNFSHNQFYNQKIDKEELNNLSHNILYWSTGKPDPKFMFYFIFSSILKATVRTRPDPKQGGWEVWCCASDVGLGLALSLQMEGAPVMGRDKRLGTGGSASPGVGIQRRKWKVIEDEW